MEPQTPEQRVTAEASLMRPQKDSIKIIECYRFARIFGVYRVCPQLPRTAWLVTDICGLVCAVFTWLLVLYAEFVVNAVMIMPLQLTFYKCFNGILFNLLSFLAITSHLRAMLSDPGAVPKGNATKENIHKLGLKDGQVVYRCPKCVSIKPDRAHHCSVCRRCIKKMDHHCPWVNNCVGEGNQKYFVLFTMYIFLISFHALYMVVVHFITCVGSRWEACDSYSPPVQTVLTIFLTFESLLFGIFTAIMFGSQMQAICSDETGIESLKQEYMPYEKKSKWMNIKMVFGHPFSIYWFSPFHNAVNLGKLDSYHYTV